MSNKAASPARNLPRLGPEGSAFFKVPTSEAAGVRARGSKWIESQFSHRNRAPRFRIKSISAMLPESLFENYDACRGKSHATHKSRKLNGVSSQCVWGHSNCRQW